MKKRYSFLLEAPVVNRGLAPTPPPKVTTQKDIIRFLGGDSRDVPEVSRSDLEVLSNRVDRAEDLARDTKWDVEDAEQRMKDRFERQRKADAIKQAERRKQDYSNFGAVAGGALGGFAGAKIGGVLGKTKQLEQFKYLVAMSDSPEDLLNKVKGSKFDRIYPNSLKLIQKYKDDPKWKDRLLGKIRFKKLAAPAAGGLVGAGLGGVAGYYGGGYLSNHV